MYVLIMSRRGITIGVFTHEDKNAAKREAERIDGAVLTWMNFLSHEGAHSNHDGERSYEVHKATEVSRNQPALRCDDLNFANLGDRIEVASQDEGTITPGSAEEGIAAIKTLFEDPLYDDNPGDLVAQIEEVLSSLHPVSRNQPALRCDDPNCTNLGERVDQPHRHTPYVPPGATY